MEIFGYVIEWKGYKKEPITSAEEKLQKIKDILFPEFEYQGNPNSDDLVCIDHCLDTNLNMAIRDLEDGYNDEKTMKVLNKVEETLFTLRKILNANYDIDSNTKYVVPSGLDDGEEREII